MGKLPIIPRIDTARDNVARAEHGREERQEKATTTKTTAVAVEARFSATDGAIADNATADPDRRFLIASTCGRVSRGGEEEEEEEERARRRRPGRADDLVARRRRRRHTWHAESKGDVVRVTDRDLTSATSLRTGNDAERDCALDAAVGLWNVRIADDDDHRRRRRRTCCAIVPVDAATLIARRRRAHDRRAGGVLLAHNRSDTEEIFRSAVDSITIEREAFEIPLVVGATDLSECNERTSPNASVRDDVNGGSPTAVRKIDSSINVGNPSVEIGIVESSCEERVPLSAEETVHRRGTSSTFTRFPAKIDPGGNAWRTSTRWRLPRIGFLQRALLLGLLATSLLCDAVLAAPQSPSLLEDGVEEEDMAAMPRNSLGDDELEIIRRSIVQGLGLQRIPDPSKANVSQAEYERAHREYLKRVQLPHDEDKSRTRRDLHIFQAAEHPGNKSSHGSSRRAGYHRHSLYFPVAISGDAATEEDVTVDHASLRFLLQGDHRRPRDLEALVYLRTPVSRRLLLRRGIPQGEPMSSRWLELDTTEAAASWLEHGLENHGLELEFLHDGRPIRREVSHATLNVFATSEPGGRRKRSTPEELMPLQHKGRRSKCKGDNNKKCCRHELTVMFKDLKGFEFIVYPKGFDAGYCKGRCPPRYNPAHHHALLQSLLWKEDRKRVPKPCCAPSKLDQLMIVYFDENDSTQLKVSYWKNIQVLECACS